MRESLFGLRLIAVEARKLISEFGGGAPEGGDAGLREFVRAGNFRGRRGARWQDGFNTRHIALERRNRFPVLGGARFHLSGLRGRLFDFKMELLAAAGQFLG